MERVFYTFFQEERADREMDRCPAYSIAAFLRGEGKPVKVLRDVSPDRKKVAHIVRVMNLTGLPADYLESTVKDLLDS